jgi:hypothetical protein
MAISKAIALLIRMRFIIVVFRFTELLILNYFAKIQKKT